jgi:hypothetical protein
MSGAAVSARPRRGQLLLLVLLFFAPLLLAFLVYYGSGWRPAGRTNHGQLIEPPRALPVTGAAVMLHGKWSLLYVGDEDCRLACDNTLYFMRQTQLGLGNLIPRVQRIFLRTRDCCGPPMQQSGQPPLLLLDAAGAESAALRAALPSERDASSIFIVDPRGNLMLRYQATDDPKGLREDLKKLLALSSIG